MDTMTSLPSSKSSGSNGVSTPFENLAFTLAIKSMPFESISHMLAGTLCRPTLYRTRVLGNNVLAVGNDYPSARRVGSRSCYCPSPVCLHS